MSDTIIEVPFESFPLKTGAGQVGPKSLTVITKSSLPGLPATPLDEKPLFILFNANLSWDSSENGKAHVNVVHPFVQDAAYRLPALVADFGFYGVEVAFIEPDSIGMRGFMTRSEFFDPAEDPFEGATQDGLPRRVPAPPRAQVGNVSGPMPVVIEHYFNQTEDRLRSIADLSVEEATQRFS